MKRVQSSNARKSQTAIILGCVLGLIGGLWLFILWAVIGLSGRPNVGLVIVNIVPVLIPVGLLVFGIIKGLQANREIRQSGEINKKQQSLSLMIGGFVLIIYLIVYAVIVLGMMKLVAVCLQTPLQCSFY